MNLLILVITLLLLFWLISLVWSQNVARRVFQISAYILLAITLVVVIYMSVEGFRWVELLHQLNKQSIATAQLINNPPALKPD